MRLYRLISRYGQGRTGITPWFKAPVAGAPVRYFGWAWDPAIKEWVARPVEPVDIDLQVPSYPRPPLPPRSAQPIYVPGWYWYGRAGRWEEMPFTPQELSEGIERGPMPKFPPGPGVSTEVEGWSWSETTDEWVATIVMGERIRLEPPLPLPPFITEADVARAEVYNVDIRAVADVLKHRWDPIVGMTMQNIDSLIRMLLKSGMSEAAARRLMVRFSSLTAGMSAQEKAVIWHHAAQSIIDMWRQSHNVSTSNAQHLWAEGVAKRFNVQVPWEIRAYVIVALVLFAAAFGVIIAKMIQALIAADVKILRLMEKRVTYLLGPGNWLYSRHIGMSAKGRPFYSACQEIGTEFVRHKRYKDKGGLDWLDFPGGFLETGYVFPRFVKYVWDRWEIQYVGMLERSGADFFVLKSGDFDSLANLVPATFWGPERWCEDFHWYL